MVLFDNSQNLLSKEIQIYSYQHYDGLTNMAVDHYIAANYHIFNRPVLRFYGWNPYCISIGFHQSSKNIDLISLRKNGYDLVKRPTGGRAIFHSEEITYSVIFPKTDLTQKELYIYIHKLFTSVLNKLDYKVILAEDKPKLPKLLDHSTDYPCFTRSAETEVEFEGKKLIGSAQKIYKDSILQHGSILIGKFHENLINYLIATDTERKIIDQEIKSQTICLRNINNKNITAQDIENETLQQLESNNNLSLIFSQFNEDFFVEARKFYNNEINNK